MNSLHCGSGTRAGHLIPFPSYLSKVAGASEMKQIVRRMVFAVGFCSSKGIYGNDSSAHARQRRQLPSQVTAKGPSCSIRNFRAQVRRSALGQRHGDAPPGGKAFSRRRCFPTHALRPSCAIPTRDTSAQSEERQEPPPAARLVAYAAG